MSSIPEAQADSSANAAPGAANLGLTVAAVARRLGVAPATLRTWDRRYGLGPSTHQVGAHRKYSAEDLARLEHMRRLVLAGIPPGDAARDALALAVDAASLAPVTDILRTATYPSDPPAASAHEFGHVIPMKSDVPAVRGLARAAITLDGAACERLVADAVEKRGVVWTWEQVLVPVLGRVGDKWARDGRGIDVEHVLSSAIESVFVAQVRRLDSPLNPRPVLLAAAEDEQHVLPLWAVAAALAERHVGCQMLGARVPFDTLVHAARRTGPPAIFLWAQVPVVSKVDQLNELNKLRPAASVVVGGPGWPTKSSVSLAQVFDLTEATARLSRAVGL